MGQSGSKLQLTYRRPLTSGKCALQRTVITKIQWSWILEGDNVTKYHTLLVISDSQLRPARQMQRLLIVEAKIQLEADRPVSVNQNTGKRTHNQIPVLARGRYETQHSWYWSLSVIIILYYASTTVLPLFHKRCPKKLWTVPFLSNFGSFYSSLWLILLGH